MIRHRSRPTRALGAAALAATAFFISFLSPSRARAQSVELSISDMFVASQHAPACSSSGTPPQFTCPLFSTPTNGDNISNNPEINFQTDSIDRCNVAGGGNVLFSGTAVGLPGDVGYNVCNDAVFLCAQLAIGGLTGTLAIDSIEFDVFQFVNGANPLDPTSTPPLKTFFVSDPGFVTQGGSNCESTNTNNPSSGDCNLPSAAVAYCVLWDGSQNIQGGNGKINGQYGFRVTAQTNQVGQSGNITITQVAAYPAGSTEDSNGDIVAQLNVTENVTDVHVINSTPTIVGQITGVAAEPYNFTYRLSKSATMYINVLQSQSPFSNIRAVVPGLPRIGEGNLGAAGVGQTPPAPLINGDSWDGRDANGNMLPPGNYLVMFQANASDQFTGGNKNSSGVTSDLSNGTTLQIGLDPLQITDIRVQPLAGGSTSLAVLTYQLTEPATVYVDIYPPGTSFCNDSSGNPSLNDVNNPATDNPSGVPAKNFAASSAGCLSVPVNGSYAAAPVLPLRTVVQQQQSRTPVITFWNGVDLNGNVLGDGDYVFVLYAALPSRDGQPYNHSATDLRIWTSLGKNGYIPVLRGLVGITQVTPTSTVIGSSPAIAGLSPFTFGYQLSRDAVVSLKILNAAGTSVIKTIVNQEVRPGLFNNSEIWSDGNDDNGLAVASGTYLVQLTAADENFPMNISTTTALFPVDNFRVTDVNVSPLLSGASAQVSLSYQLSQGMFIAWNIYPAGSVISNAVTSWPPCAGQSPPGACTSSSVLSPPPASVPVPPIITFHGFRAGRLKITEFWSGTDINGLLVPDGNYVFTLTAQSTVTPEGTAGTPPFYATDHVEGTIAVARGSIFFTSFNVTPTVPSLFNSSNTITLDPFTVNYAVTRQSSVTIQIQNTSIPPQVLRTVVAGGLRNPGILNTDVWDGRDNSGNFLPWTSGGTPYIVQVTAQDLITELPNPTTAQQTILYDPLRIYDLAVTPNSGTGAIVSYQVSEPMKISIKVYKPGTSFDASGNPSPPEVNAAGQYVSLVKRIVGIRPSRTQIQDVWNGTDFTLSQVPDGTYKFKIVGSTDAAAIDSVTGNVLYPNELADDRLTDDLPSVTNGGATNPQADLNNNSFIYPNPVTGPSGTFSIYTPYQADVKLSLYTIAGQLILNQVFGPQAASYQNGPVTYVWNKVNQSGRSIARGLYYAVIRIEQTDGGTQVLQTVKKVLVP